MKNLFCIAALAFCAPVALADVSITYTDGNRIHTREIKHQPIVTQADADLLYLRLERVSKQVCARHGPTLAQARAGADARTCRTEALRAGVISANNARVTAIYEAR